MSLTLGHSLTLYPTFLQIGLRQSTMIPADLRAYAQALLTTLPSQLLIPYLHPVFYSLHNMPKDVRALSFGLLARLPH